MRVRLRLRKRARIDPDADPNVSPDRGRPRALAISLGLHIAAFCGLMYAPPFNLPSMMASPSPGEYQQAFAGKEDKIVWYKFRELPDIRPPDSNAIRQPVRAEVHASERIVSSLLNAPKRHRVVVTPAPVPDVELPPPDLPNLLAVKLPPKKFTTPPDVMRPEARAVDVPDAADAPVTQLEAANLPTVRLPPRPFTPAPMPPKTPRVAVRIEPLDDAPGYQAQSTASTTLPAIRLPSRTFVPPRVAQKHEPSIEVPPAIEVSSVDLTIAAASLDPAVAAVKLPVTPSPAQFSAGEKVRPDGANTDNAGKGIVVADLYAHPNSEQKPALLATASIPAPHGVLTPPAPATYAPAPRLATRVSSSPDPRFNGRDVYMMAIQMPNLTSYSGSWLMWYAPRSIRNGGLDPVSAPEAHRKVDPKYIASAVDEHVEGRVQLYCVISREGIVSSIELLRGADERLNRSAEEALSKWEFYPAMRNGQPVDVDVVVEIPFVLAPQGFHK